MPGPHDDSGTFFFVKPFRSQPGTETHRSRAATPYDRSAILWVGASSASSPGGTTGPAWPGAGGTPSAGAGTPAGGAVSAGAGIPPAGGSFCAGPPQAKPQSTSRAAHSGRVMDVSGLWGVVKRAGLYTRRSSFQGPPPTPLKCELAGSD